MSTDQSSPRVVFAKFDLSKVHKRVISNFDPPGTKFANFDKLRDQSCKFFNLFTQGPIVINFEFPKTYVNISSISQGPFLTISKLEGPFLPILQTFCSKDYFWYFVILQGVF